MTGLWAVQEHDWMDRNSADNVVFFYSREAAMTYINHTWFTDDGVPFKDDDGNPSEPDWPTEGPRPDGGQIWDDEDWQICLYPVEVETATSFPPGTLHQGT